jgi:hypothetical protein
MWKWQLQKRQETLTKYHYHPPVFHVSGCGLLTLELASVHPKLFTLLVHKRIWTGYLDEAFERIWFCGYDYSSYILINSGFLGY